MIHDRNNLKLGICFNSMSNNLIKSKILADQIICPSLACCWGHDLYVKKVKMVIWVLALNVLNHPPTIHYYFCITLLPFFFHLATWNLANQFVTAVLKTISNRSCFQNETSCFKKILFYYFFWTWFHWASVNNRHIQISWNMNRVGIWIAN